MSEDTEKVARAALARRNWLIAFKKNINSKGDHHEHTKWSQGKFHEAERELDEALNSWIVKLETIS